MLYHERMSINTLRMCSLGDLVVIRKAFERTTLVPVIDYEIYSRIPDMDQLFKRERQRKHLTKRRRRGIKR